MIAAAVLAIVVVAAGGVAAYLAFRSDPKTADGNWTYLGSATNAAEQLGGTSTMAVYACVEKSSTTSWTVRAKAELAPRAANPGNYTLTLVIWPYKSLADAPGGQESPRGQVATSAWSAGQVALVQTRVTAADSNFVQTTAASKDHGSKILPAPLNGWPSAAALAVC